MTKYTYNTDRSKCYVDRCIGLAKELWGNVILQATTQTWADGSTSVCVSNRPTENEKIIGRRIRFHEDIDGKPVPHLSIEVDRRGGSTNRKKLSTSRLL